MEQKKRSQPGFQRFLGIPVAYEVSVGAVVVRRSPEGFQCLLLQYPHGHWDFVKGHVEPGESYEETLRREAQEEAGIEDLEVLPGFRERTRYFYVAKGSEREKRIRLKKGLWIFKTVYFYLAESKTADVRLSHEHIGYAWLLFPEAIEKVTFPATKRILQGAEAFLKKGERTA
jgi:bis(5'-nucleosidyl)-tetraphosphatase